MTCRFDKSKRSERSTGWAKKWHPFGIWVSFVVRCIIFAIFVYSRIIFIKLRRSSSANKNFSSPHLQTLDAAITNRPSMKLPNIHTYIHIRLIEVDIRNQTENYALTRRKVMDDEIMLNKVAVTNCSPALAKHLHIFCWLGSKISSSLSVELSRAASLHSDPRNLLLQGRREHGLALWIAYVDLRAAFDSV